jgi:hypothetical protein
MVHIEYASIASRAMMASLWLENVAHQAISSPFVFVITKMEAPEDWDLTRISGHRLEE